MGAAIRHATNELIKIPARTHILIVISDGFPNDIGYKKAYAIEDTRKAVFEARSKQISFKAIAVNIAGDPKLDDLYGKYHHSLIAHINDLPGKLLGIYGAMTRT
jgi:nitric oxide reductase activation protein